MDTGHVMSKADGPMQSGTIKWWRDDRGFIVADEGFREIFAHASQLVDQGHELSKGERVSFCENVGRDGRSYCRRIEVIR
jgi:cold shock CspA family protein